MSRPVLSIIPATRVIEMIRPQDIIAVAIPGRLHLHKVIEVSLLRKELDKRLMGLESIDPNMDGSISIQSIISVLKSDFKAVLDDK